MPKKVTKVRRKPISLGLRYDASVVDEDCKKMAMFAIQQARMFANQGITVDSLLKNE